MSGDARGGNDCLITAGNDNYLRGDGDTMSDRARGGNDSLAATGDICRLNGDGSIMSGDARGGDDSLAAAGNYSQLFGDALYLSGDARGGHDSLTVLGVTGDRNYLYGDAQGMFDTATGGNDRLTGSNGDDLIVGDAQTMSETARGGNDRLWGDANGASAGGADTFLFAGHSGRDLVFDFRPEEGDTLELRGYGFDDVSDLSITAAGGSTVIDIGASLGQAANTDIIRLAGFHDPLTSGDFIFA